MSKGVESGHWGTSSESNVKNDRDYGREGDAPPRMDACTEPITIWVMFLPEGGVDSPSLRH
jgi:hypothetical protein